MHFIQQVSGQGFCDSILKLMLPEKVSHACDSDNHLPFGKVGPYFFWNSLLTFRPRRRRCLCGRKEGNKNFSFPRNREWHLSDLTWQHSVLEYSNIARCYSLSSRGGRIFLAKFHRTTLQAYSQPHVYYFLHNCHIDQFWSNTTGIFASISFPILMWILRTTVSLTTDTTSWAGLTSN